MFTRRLLGKPAPRLCFWTGTAKIHAVRRTLFHELRDPHPVALSINQRTDWPLTDLKRIPTVHSVAAMNSLELTQHAERLCARARGDWDAILIRFQLLVSEMDADLSARLLRCLARSKFDTTALPSVVQALPIEGKPPSNLTCWSSALLDLRERLGDEELQKVFQRLEHAALKSSKEIWGLSAPMMLISIVRYGSVALSLKWSPTCNLMGPMHLEIAAYSCARLHRSSGKDPEASKELVQTATVLLENGTRRVSRFLPRGLLNFYVALERILGQQVAQLSMTVCANASCKVVFLAGAALCLLRGCEIDEALRQSALQALKILLDGQAVHMSQHGRRALRKRLERSFGEDLNLKDLTRADES
eukprot:symbB.v1.2.034827.t1/scaffold4561.1/size37971/6